MDFLRLRLPGLHQALRGALDSFSAFVSYLVGDAVPTVEREPQAAEELGEVAAGDSGKVVEEEAQEELEALRSGQSERVGVPEETIRCQEGSLAGEQTQGWRADSSTRRQAESQDTGSRKAAEGARGQEPSAPLKPEAGPGIHKDRTSGRAQEIWEHSEEEESSGEPLRACEQKEEKEEVVRAAEPGMARGVESQPTWHREPQGNAGTDGQNVSEDGKETDWVAQEVAAKTEGSEARGPDREEKRMVAMRDGHSARGQGTQAPGAESEDWAMLGIEAWAVSGREEANSLGIQEAEFGPDQGDNIPEAPGRPWVLEETCKGDQQDEVDEKREDEVRLLIQTLEMERTEEMTEGQIAGREAVGGQETGDSLEDEGRQDLAMGDNGVSQEEKMQAEESPEEKRSYLATEAMLVLAKEAKNEPDWEESPEAKPEELFMGEKVEAEQMRAEVLRVKVAEGQDAEGQDAEVMRGSQTLTTQLEEGQGCQEMTRKAPDLSSEGMLSLEEYPRPVEFAGPELEAWGNWRRDMDSRNTQKVKADAEAGEEEIVTGQAVEIQAEGGQKAQQPEVPGWGAEETGAGQSVGEPKPTEDKASQGEAPVPGEAERASRKRGPEEAALSLQDREATQTGSLAAEIILGVRTVGAEEGPRWEAGVAPEREFGKDWHSKDRGEAAGGTELEEAAEKQSGQDVGLEGSTEEVSSCDIREIGGTGEGEQAEVGTSVMAEGVRGADDLTSGSRAERAEGSKTTTETEGLEEEAGGGPSGEWKTQDSEGETQKLQGVEDAVSTGHRTEIKETDPEGLEDSSGQETQPAHQIPTVAVPGSSESAEAPAGDPGDAHSDWHEALLPGSRLDVSVPRSRVLLSRNSSRRRSRPSFRRISAPEPHYDPPSPQPQEEPSFPEPSPLQPEETPEPSAPRTPVPAKRKVLGHGFGFAHPGMMQELQARLSRPKPQ
ncbi:apolipoprotein B receptor [Meriones unguiculatus]|uniref:apolipoprotein B receptor n=1 Tax=Meriones unguiculatus TaxID=10047 RepID=UPI000B4F53F5|nr:apolipoprotein B receptor [Meriones unguiculatus]